MNLFFWRRSGLREFAEAIQPELRAMHTPEPDDALLQRILASRESGTRIILPEASSSRRPMARVVVAVVAAAVLLVVVPIIRRIPSSPEEMMSVSSFLESAAFAQTLEGGDAPELPPVHLTRTSTIRPLAMELVRRIHDGSGKLTSELTGTISVAADEIDGTPAWRVTSVDQFLTAGQLRFSVETLYVARADLRPLQRAVHVSPYRRFQRINIQQHFQGDSVTGRMTTDGPSIGAGRPIARRLPPRFGPYVSGAMAPLLLMAAPLSAEWMGSASLLGWAVIDRDVMVPMELRVVGEERVRVPAGEFDCWRMSIQVGRRRVDYWARKSDGLGVRVYDQSGVVTPGMREIVLRSVR